MISEICNFAKIFKDFTSYNNYLGLSSPLDNDIDVGYYEPEKILLISEPIIVDFYRISIKVGYKDKFAPNPKPVNAVFFNSPEIAVGWDVDPVYTGMYLFSTDPITASLQIFSRV